MLFADGLSRIIRSAGFKSVFSSPVLDADTLAKAASCTSALLILDVEDLGTALHQVEMARERLPDAKLAVITDDANMPKAVMALQQRAHAYVRRNCSCQSFIKVLELVGLGERFVPTVILPLVADAKPDTALSLDDTVEYGALVPYDATFSTQEARILCLIVDGHSNKAIARQLSIAEATVKVHVKSVLRKLNVSNRTQAAIWAIKNRPQRAEPRTPLLEQSVASTH